MAADMTDEQFAEMVKKPRAETPQNTPFTWIVSFTCGNDADYEELLKLFTDYRPKAQALGAKTFDVVKSVKGRTIFVYEVRQALIWEVNSSVSPLVVSNSPTTDRTPPKHTTRCTLIPTSCQPTIASEGST
jgi:hypothetical protein